LLRAAASWRISRGRRQPRQAGGSSAQPRFPSRLRRLVGIIEELSFTTVRHRLVSLLFRLAQREGRQTAEGLEFSLPANNQELASQIGTVRELVLRNLSRLQAEGLVTVEAGVTARRRGMGAAARTVARVGQREWSD